MAIVWYAWVNERERERNSLRVSHKEFYEKRTILYKKRLYLMAILRYVCVCVYAREREEERERNRERERERERGRQCTRAFVRMSVFVWVCQKRYSIKRTQLWIKRALYLANRAPSSLKETQQGGITRIEKLEYTKFRIIHTHRLGYSTNRALWSLKGAQHEGINTNRKIPILKN